MKSICIAVALTLLSGCGRKAALETFSPDAGWYSGHASTNETFTASLFHKEFTATFDRALCDVNYLSSSTVPGQWWLTLTARSRAPITLDSATNFTISIDNEPQEFLGMAEQKQWLEGGNSINEITANLFATEQLVRRLGRASKAELVLSELRSVDLQRWTLTTNNLHAIAVFVEKDVAPFDFSASNAKLDEAIRAVRPRINAEPWRNKILRNNDRIELRARLHRDMCVALTNATREIWAAAKAGLPTEDLRAVILKGRAEMPEYESELKKEMQSLNESNSYCSAHFSVAASKDDLRDEFPVCHAYQYNGEWFVLQNSSRDGRKWERQ